MLSKKELERAIAECEQAQGSYQNCEKLATFYTIYDHLYTETQPKAKTTEETVIGDYGDTDFLRMIRGRKAGPVWLVMDELLQALMVTDSRLYDSVLRKLS